MWAGEGSADEMIETKGLKQITDTGAIEALVDEVSRQLRAGRELPQARYHPADDLFPRRPGDEEIPGQGQSGPGQGVAAQETGRPSAEGQ